MKVVANYNKISEELKKKIPPMKDVVTFQLLNGRPNPDEHEAKKTPMLYPKTQLLTSFRVKDGAGFVDIVHAEDWVDNKPTKAKMFVVGMGEIFCTGKVDLRKGNVEDEELYEVLMLSPERKDTICPDPSVKPKFKLLDAIGDSREKSTLHDILLKAMTMAKEIETNKEKETAEKIMASMNQSYGTDEELYTAVKTFARNKPEVFIKLHSDPDTTLKAEVKNALDKGIFAFNPATLVLSHNESTLTTLKSGENVIDDVAAWLNSAANGKQILTAVRKQLKKAPEKELVA